MIAYLRLFRADAALIAFVSYLIGAELAGGARLQDVAAAALVTCISTNFIYSFNSWADRRIDAVNKPWRPVPAGQITAEKALFYSLFLLVMAVVYPFFIAHSLPTLFLFELLPVLGLLYSAKPFSFRRNSLLSTLTISIGLVTPLMLGCFMNTSETRLLTSFFGLFVYCISVVPLKDIEDAEGDRAFGIRNLYLSWGSRLPLFSLAGLTADLVWICLVPLPQILKIHLTVVMSSTMACILIFQCFRLNMKKLYGVIIRTVIALAIILNIVIRWG
ncbi:MAG: UbiA family prenyltransferase [Deltaproteobacteria bacterium]|nr:UbiA family prenyltransferase [Deltaproteobacteria bacterium]